MSAVLSHREHGTEMLAGIINGINRLDDTRRELLTILPTLEDEQIIQTRMGARALGVWSWVIECACDAEMMKRVEAKRGRGNKDVDEKGKVAAVNKHAALCGQTPGTLYRNAQIYKTFKNVLIDQNNLLEDKGFYEAALRAPDPEEAIEIFAKEKDEDAFFSVRDAHRRAEKLKRKQEETARPKLSAEMQKLHDDAVREDIELHIATIKKANETSVDPLVSTLNHRIIEKLEWQRDRSVEGDCSKILEAINDGYQVEQDILDWLSDRLFLMTEPQFDDRLDLMLGSRKIKTTKQGGKGERTRGDRTTMYVLYGARTGDAYISPHANSIYSQGEQE